MSPVVQAFIAGICVAMFLGLAICGIVIAIRETRASREAEQLTPRELRKHHERARRELLGSVLTRMR